MLKVFERCSRFIPSFFNFDTETHTGEVDEWMVTTTGSSIAIGEEPTTLGDTCRRRRMLCFMSIGWCMLTHCTTHQYLSNETELDGHYLTQHSCAAISSPASVCCAICGSHFTPFILNADQFCILVMWMTDRCILVILNADAQIQSSTHSQICDVSFVLPWVWLSAYLLTFHWLHCRGVVKLVRHDLWIKM